MLLETRRQTNTYLQRLQTLLQIMLVKVELKVEPVLSERVEAATLMPVMSSVLIRLFLGVKGVNALIKLSAFL